MSKPNEQYQLSRLKDSHVAKTAATILQPYVEKNFILTIYT